MDISRRYQIFKAVIWPVLLYGLTLWFKLGGKGIKHLIKHMSVAQNASLHWITGAFRTTPISALEFYSGVPPVDIFADLSFKKWALRIVKLDDSHPIREILAHTRFSFLDDLPARSSPGPTAITRNVFSRTIWRVCDEVFIPFNSENIPGSSVAETFGARIELRNLIHPRKSDSREFQAWLQEFSTWLSAFRLHSNNIIIATDGSLRKGRGASGFSVWSQGIMIHADTWTVSADSSFAAELQAIQGAFEYLINSTTTGRVLFLVDNVTALSQIFDTSIHQNQLCSIRAMKILRHWFLNSSSNALIMSCCPSHMGILENDTIDKFVGAKVVQRSNSVITPHRSFTATKKLFEDSARNNWSFQLKTNSGSHWLRPRGSRGRLVKPAIGKSAKKRWKFADNNIELFSRVVRFQTGHMPSGEFNNRIRRRQYGFCRFCEGAPHSRRHIFDECSKYKRTQGSTISSLSHSHSTFAKTVKFFKDNPTAGSFDDSPTTDA